MEKSGGDDEVFGKKSDNVNWQVVYGDEGIWMIRRFDSLNVVFDPPIKFLIGRIYLLGEISTDRGEKFYDTVWKSLSEVFSFHMTWIVILIWCT